MLNAKRVAHIQVGWKVPLHLV